MKKYDNKLKKYVTQEEWDKSHKHKDKDLCKGKRPHDFVLVLPFHITYNSTYKFNPEMYYKIVDEINEFKEKQDKRLIDMGIVKRYGDWNRAETRCFMCSVCKKQKYEYAK